MSYIRKIITTAYSALLCFDKMINFVSLDSKLIFITYDQAGAVRDESVAEADCGNGCQDCQDYSSQDDETQPGLWLAEWDLYWLLIGRAFMVIFSWSAIWKCCNNNLKTIGIWDIKSKPLIYSSSNVLNFSFLIIDVCLTWHGNYLFRMLPQYVHLMMIYTRPGSWKSTSQVSCPPPWWYWKRVLKPE